MVLWTDNPRQGFDHDVSSYPNVDDWRRQSTAFAEMAAYVGRDVALTHAGDPAGIRGALVTPGFFDTLGVAPALGRTFRASAASAGSDRVAVLSHALWQMRFESDPAILGRTVVLNGVAHEVLGVMPASFEYPDRTQIWMPLPPAEGLGRCITISEIIVGGRSQTVDSKRTERCPSG